MSATMRTHFSLREFDSNKDLDDILSEFQSDYKTIAEAKLEPNANFMTIQSDIEKTLDGSRLKNTKRSKQILGDVRQCLQKFGEIAASGASLVFPASTQCWNVVNVIIHAIQKHQEILDGFIALMERSSVFLGRLNSFLAKKPERSGEILPISLRKPAYQILHLFLGVLKASYKVTAKGKRNICRTYMKIFLFNEDFDVSNHLRNMETKIHDFTTIQVDEILMDMKGLARYCTSKREMEENEDKILAHLQEICGATGEMANVLQQIKETSESLANRQQHADNLDKIRRNLSLGFNNHSWVERHNAIGAVSVEGTGNWLTSLDVFKAWSDTSRHCTRVLLLKTGSGFGKSHAINRVVQDLLETYDSSVHGPAPVRIAYYYLNDGKDDSFERCIGSIIYQLSQVDHVYAKAVAAVCEKQASGTRAQERWERLVPELAYAMKGTYFICIDGYDTRARTGNADTTIANMIRHTSELIPKGIFLRLIIAGAKEMVPTVKAEPGSVYDIILNACPDDDRKIVIRYRIAQVIKEKPPLKTVLNESNINKLIDNIKDYKLLDMKIAQIKLCSSQEEVQDIVDKTGYDWNALLREKIQDLRSSLSPSQLSDLNEMLKWMMRGRKPKERTWVAIGVLQGVLYLKSRGKMFLDDTIPRFYSPLLRVDGQDVILHSDDYLQILCGDGDDTETDKSPNGKITKPEIDMCSRIIQNVCGPEDYKRFNFAKFFKDLTENQKSDILVDPNTAQFAIVTSCVEVFHAPHDEFLGDLENYASYWLWEHLKILIENPDSHRLENDRITDVGSKLVDLFYTPEHIDRWFTDERLPRLKADWVDKDEFINPLLEFWKASYAAKGFRRTEEKDKWAMSLLSTTGSNFEVLEHIAKRMAISWFGSDKLVHLDHLWISWGIFKKRTKHDVVKEDPPSLPYVNEFIQWAENHANSGCSNPVWTFCKGRVYLVFGYYHAATAAFEEVKEQMSSNWYFLFDASCAHRNIRDYKLSLDYIRKLKSLPEYLKDEEYGKFLLDHIPLAEVHNFMQLEDFGSAVTICQDLLQKSFGDKPIPDHTKKSGLERLFECWYRIGQHKAIIEHMETWRNLTDGERGLSYWFGFIADNSSIQNHIIAAAKATRSVGSVLTLVQRAGEATASDTFLGAMRYFEAALLVHGGHSYAEHDKGISIWEEVIQSCDRASISEWSLEHTVHDLATIFLRKATVLEPGPVTYITARTYFNRLQKLCRENFSNGIYADSPRLCLIRLHVVRQEIEAAHREAKESLYTALNDWPEDLRDGSFVARFLGLAKTLTVLDDDQNAVAAWQATKPRGGTREFEATSITPEMYLGSGFICDGCSVDNKNFIDSWICKQCPNVTFCASCQQKFREDTLPPRTCGKDHEMLYLPPIPESWKSMSDDQMMVGGQVRSRSEWINEIREKYEAHQEQIEKWKLNKATAFAHRWRRRLRNKQRVEQHGPFNAS